MNNFLYRNIYISKLLHYKLDKKITALAEDLFHSLPKSVKWLLK